MQIEVLILDSSFKNNQLLSYLVLIHTLLSKRVSFHTYIIISFKELFHTKISFYSYGIN